MHLEDVSRWWVMCGHLDFTVPNLGWSWFSFLYTAERSPDEEDYVDLITPHTVLKHRK